MFSETSVLTTATMYRVPEVIYQWYHMFESHSKHARLCVYFCAGLRAYSDLTPV
jgi:hypothetical protein